MIQLLNSSKIADLRISSLKKTTFQNNLALCNLGLLVHKSLCQNFFFESSKFKRSYNILVATKWQALEVKNIYFLRISRIENCIGGIAQHNWPIGQHNLTHVPDFTSLNLNTIGKILIWQIRCPMTYVILEKHSKLMRICPN